MKLTQTVIFFLLLSPTVFAQNTKVLIVGDSWAQQQYSDDVHDAVFDVNGYPDFEVYKIPNGDDAVAVDGSTAADWVVPTELAKITNTLMNNPDIDTVQLTIGGNDFLNNWNKNMTMMEVDALKMGIVADIQTIVDAILAVDINIEIIMSFYDYPNFEETTDDFWEFICAGIYNDMQNPSPVEINSMALEFTQAFVEISENNPKVFHVPHWGRMQNAYGWPENGIQPGDIQLPGDVTLTSPLAAMRVHLGFVNDCFHLSAEGYDVLVQALFEDYYHFRFDTIHKSLFE